MIRARSKRTLPPVLAAAVLASGCAPPDAPPGAPRDDRLQAAYLELLAAEDARPRAGPALAALREAATSPVAYLRQVAVRALGRLESPALSADIAALLGDPAPSVRAEAANALAQSVHRSGDEAVLGLLVERAATESDPVVLAALARSIGRSASTEAGRARAQAALSGISRAAEPDEPLATLLGVTLGFEALVRRGGAAGLGEAAAGRLSELTTYGTDPDLGPEGARVRSLAYSALGQAGRLDGALIERAMRDRSETVRLVAARHLDGLPPSSRPELLRRLLADSSPLVALEAVRQVASEPRTPLYCRYLLAGAEPDVPPAIRILSLDALARACPERAPQLRALREASAGIAQAAPGAWQPHAHAFLALASLAPEDADPLLALFSEDEDPFVRAYAARGAALLEDRAALLPMLSDPAANVRTAAAQGLFDLDGHAIDQLLLAQLDGDDPQLLLTVAGLLEGSSAGPSVAERCLSTFERISRAGRETWRDPRRALLARVAEHGDASLAARLRPFLVDYDPLVADDVARILEDWSGGPVVAEPRPLEATALPTSDGYAGLVGSSVVLHMRAGGSIVIELLPTIATTNVFRFVRLAEAGYFDGLTFHRWAPNFVIQGGSPGANEYQGAGPYSRDEVGLPVHWRGTVGISTRGRDTGDAQIFVNLVDNVRLNHDYTIVGRVVEGMEVVDAVLEGHAIDRAEVRRPR